MLRPRCLADIKDNIIRCDRQSIGHFQIFGQLNIASQNYSPLFYLIFLLSAAAIPAEQYYISGKYTNHSAHFMFSDNYPYFLDTQGCSSYTPNAKAMIINCNDHQFHGETIDFVLPRRQIDPQLVLKKMRNYHNQLR
jgi:hypothetical protein